MPSILVYGPRMGSAFRVHWMLAELNLPYETAQLDMAAGDHKKAEYLAVNPAGQVPALVYDGFVLAESVAILTYLAEKHDPSLFGPSTPEAHAVMIRWGLFALLNIDKNLVALASKTWGQPAGEEVEAKALEVLGKHLPILERQLADQSYLGGEAFTIADIVARSSFRYAEAVNFDFAAYPAIRAWMARCAERSAFKKALQG